MELFFQRVDGGGGLARVDGNLARGAIQR
jgi:hypothetical protein